MASNFVQAGATVSAIAPAPLASGQGVLIGDLFGVAQHRAGNGEHVEIGLTGVYRLPVAGSVSFGAAAFWDAVAGKATASSAEGTLPQIGHFLCEQTGGSGSVRLSP